MTLVVAHGGVSAHPPSQALELSDLLEDAGTARTALDAVEEAVRALENDPRFNAGFGAVLTLDGAFELDAGIADGATGSFGGVCTVTVANPITLARRVMDATPHVLLSAAGAMAFAGEATPVLTETTDAQRTRWRKARDLGVLDSAHYASPATADTVGAIALHDGLICAGSSSGGVFGKMPGRVGDACIFGAGVYASAAAGVVGTGIGEAFIETMAAARAGALIEEGVHPQDACEQVIRLIVGRRDVSAGLLALDRQGRAGAAYRGGSLPLGSVGLDGEIGRVRIDDI
jgi:beta-aspartyl-peptidase (threonine type)